MAFDNKKSNKETMQFKLPNRCGVAGCVEPCDIYVKEKNISRCVKHYQQDVDEWGQNHKRGTAQATIQSRMTEENSSMYQSVKSGTQLIAILKSFSARGRREV